MMGEAAPMNTNSPTITGMKLRTVLVMPVTLAAEITSLITGIATPMPTIAATATPTITLTNPPPWARLSPSMPGRSPEPSARASADRTEESGRMCFHLC
jgi:hypothetical protein